MNTSRKLNIHLIEDDRVERRARLVTGLSQIEKKNMQRLCRAVQTRSMIMRF